MYKQLIKNLSGPKKSAFFFDPLDIEEKKLNDLIPAQFLDSDKPNLPELSEPEIIRHFVEISTYNFHIDKNLYPLGSCTMKYNPKINEQVAAIFTDFHPLQPYETAQAPMCLMYELIELLKEISGFDAITLQPAAGAQGELTALLIAKAYFQDKKIDKTDVIFPDSAHGTNPASVKMAGFNPVEIKSDHLGMVDINDLKEKINDKTAVFMITNPNTLGLFEKNIEEISRIVHQHQGLLYLDGANFNALMGVVQPGKIGFDLMHFNLHKTFSTPHGGGGPGSGPVGVKDFLQPYLPWPQIKKEQEHYLWEEDCPKSIGKMMNFWGNFGVMARAYAYIRLLGKEGIKKVTENAILNANYLKKRLENHFDIQGENFCMHEFVASAGNLKSQGIRASHIAKRLLDYGFHAPTVYFPLIVAEALMIEPTETESKETLDRFADTLIQIINEKPEMLENAPHETPLQKLNEAKAAKELKIHW